MDEEAWILPNGYEKRLIFHWIVIPQGAIMPVRYGRPQPQSQ